MDKVTLSPEDAEELSRRLEILHNLTYNGRMARENRVQVSLITSLAMMRNMRHTGSGASIRPSPVSAGTWMPR